MNSIGDRPRRSLHVLAKTMGPVCNLKCEYCFYLEKRALYGHGEDYRMSDDVLRAYIEQYVNAQPVPDVEFVWHGGEPMLAGLDFYRRVIEFQKPFRSRKRIRNVVQTNGTFLTDEWCEFFRQNDFFIGLSLDGPRDVHDRYRLDRAGRPTFDAVMGGLRLLQKHGVEFNILACVARETASMPLEVYRFFKSEGVEFIQFIPIVERVPDDATRAVGLDLAPPAERGADRMSTRVTEWAVEPERYGDFLIAVFDEWVRRDVGTTFVMNFEWALASWMRRPGTVCVFSRTCGTSVALEHNGDVFACDHYVYPEYRLGNVLDGDLGAMVERSVATGFGAHKEATLPQVCRECEVLEACWGGCPKDRFATTMRGEPGLNYLCAGYKKFFLHARKYLRTIATLVENGLPPEYVMEAVNGPLVVRFDTH